MLKRRHASQRELPPSERDLDFYGAAVLTVCEFIGDLDLARAWLSEGLDLALQRTNAEQMALLRLLQARFLPPSSGQTSRDLAEAAGRRLRRSAQHRPTVMRMAYLPAAEYAAAREQQLLDASMHPVHEHYRRELQDTLRALANRPGANLRVVPFGVPGLLAYAAAEGKDPASRQTRLDYANQLSHDHDIAWPPERNAPCWCGSARKYKKCCGAPGFLDVPIPDPASLVLKIEIDGVRPPVWRRAVIPSNTTLDQVHDIFQVAMGRSNDHMYLFDTGETTIIDPRSGSQEIKADGERLISIATEAGATFRYVYDFGDEWSHTVTLEEIREAGEHNVPRVLAGSGACPPEDCGGACGYASLLQALRDPADPRHEEAAERLGGGYTPPREPGRCREHRADPSAENPAQGRQTTHKPGAAPGGRRLRGCPPRCGVVG